METLSQEEMKQLRAYTKSLHPNLTDEMLNNLDVADMKKLVDYATQTGVSPQQETPAVVGDTGTAIAASALQSLTGDNLPAIMAGMSTIAPKELSPRELQKRFEAYLADQQYTPPKDLPYEDLKKVYEEQIKNVTSTHPISSAIGVPLGLVAGGELMSGLGIGGKAVSRFASPTINKLATLAKQGAIQGAVAGAIQNTGRPEAFYESPEAAMQKGLQIGAGGVLGGTISPVIGGTGMAIEKFGKTVASIPFRKIDADLFHQNPELGKKQFSDLLWKYKTTGNYSDVKKAIDLVAKDEHYPVIQEMKKRVDEGTLGIQGEDLINILKKGINAEEGQLQVGENVSNWVDKEVNRIVKKLGLPEYEAKVAANREAIQAAKAHNEMVAQQEFPFMDLGQTQKEQVYTAELPKKVMNQEEINAAKLKNELQSQLSFPFMDTGQKTTTTAVPLTAPEKVMPPMEQVNFSLYPEQTQLQLKNLITGMDINPNVPPAKSNWEAFKYMGGSPQMIGPQKSIVMPVRAPFIVPESERPIFEALQTEIANAGILPAERRNIGGVVLPKVQPVPGQLEMGIPTPLEKVPEAVMSRNAPNAPFAVLPRMEATPGQLEMGVPNIPLMPVDVPMPMPSKGDKIPFSSLSNFVANLQRKASYKNPLAGEEVQVSGKLFKNVAAAARAERNKMAKEIAPDLFPKYEAAQKELGTIQAGRKALNKMAKAENAAGFLPLREEFIAAGLANLGGNLYNIANDDITNFPEDRSYFYPTLTALATAAAAMNRPKSGQYIGRALSNRGVNLQKVAPYLGAKTGQTILQAIPAYLQPNEEQKP